MEPRLQPLETMAYGALGLVSFFAIWTAVVLSGAVPHSFLPLPTEIVTRFAFLLTHRFAGATLPQHLLASLTRYLGGFLLAALVGVPLGLLMGWFRWLDDILTPIFDGLRFIAPIAWVPFAALWFGTGFGGPIMIIFAGAFPPCLINAHRGARFVNPSLIEAANMLGTGHLRIMTEVLLPASLPSIIAGLRVAAGLGWQSLVGAELIVAANGIGYMMVQGQANVQTSTVMAGMVSIGLVGLGMDRLLRLAELTIGRRLGQPT